MQKLAVAKSANSRRQKERTDEVNEGFEFGTMIESKIEIAVGDKIQGFRTIEKK
jgi:hypothetical protein